MSTYWDFTMNAIRLSADKKLTVDESIIKCIPKGTTSVGIIYDKSIKALATKAERILKSYGYYVTFVEEKQR